MKNNLLKKFLSFSIGGYIALIIGFMTTPIVTRMLSPEEYGISSLVMVVINMSLIFLGLGLDQGFVRHFYEEDENKRGKLLYNSIKIPFLLIALFSLFIYLFRRKISLFLFGEYNFSMIIIFIVMSFITLINRYSILVIRMNQKAKLFSIFQILSQFLNFVFILILFKKYGNNYKTLIISSLLTLISITIISIISERKIWKFQGENEKITFDKLISFSLPLSITMALSWVFSSADKLTIKYFSTLTELGLYSGAFKIIALLNIIQSGFTTFWTPVVYEKFKENDKEKVFFEKIYDYISFVMFLIGIGLLLGKDIFIMILGPKYREASDIMPMLVLMPVMYTISETTVIGINLKKKTKYHLYISILVAIFNIIGNILLVPKLGAKGAAISTGLVYVLFFSLRTYFSLKFIKYNFNLKRFYLITILLVLFALYLSFYNNLKIIISIGIILVLILLILYRKMLKDLYFEFIKKELKE